MNEYLAWAIPLAPLIAALICIVMAVSGRGRKQAHLPVWIALTISAACSVFLLIQVDVNDTGLVVGGYSWLDVGRVRVPIALQFDAISLVQICVVTVVSALVAYYAAGYMHDDPGYARFFAVFSGFVFCMAMLVLANNLLALYMFWEGVGVCSYLLIGYWYKKPSAAAAATKAFLVNRVADCGFLLGILTLWSLLGSIAADPAASGLSRLDYDNIFVALPELAANHATLLTVVGFLLLLGAVGKSAQFPLHVWLPDAMEGPTPVSALIHAATMVTAGVYLLCRMSPLLVLTPDALIVAGWLGGITALLAALIALFQDDLKRVLAYSTVSQLGYMFMAISCGVGENLMSAAVAAALFHVATHAFFKALLFLSAGNVMHAMGDIIDMRQFGGLKKVLPTTNALFAIGAAALAGVPLLAGFWSKDSILSLLHGMSHDATHGGTFMFLFLIAITTAFLTALYTTRAYLRTFHGSQKIPAAAHGHAHEMPLGMNAPLIVLALGSLGLGLLLEPTGWLHGYLHHIAYLPELAATTHGALVPMLSAAVCFAGVLTAFVMVRNAQGVRNPQQGFFARAGANRFYLDELYAMAIVVPLRWLAGLLAMLDLRVMDGLWRAVSAAPAAIGSRLRSTQSGLVSNYAGWMTIGLIALLVVALFGYMPL